MLPLLLRMQIKEKGKNKIRLFLPFFLIWIILVAILILISPLLLIAAIVLWPLGYGRHILFAIPMLFAMMCALSGLKIHIENEDKKIYLVLK
jgi:hypothetical protein